MSILKIYITWIGTGCGPHIWDGVWRGNYFGGEPIGRTGVEVRVGKLKKGKAAGKDEIT